MASHTPSFDVSAMPIAVEALTRLNRDIKAQMKDLTREEVRHLIKTYYAIQDFRIEASGQTRSLTQSGKSVLFLDWVQSNMATFERNLRSALDYYTSIESTGMGAWAKSVYGIGPVISAALVAYLDIERSPYPGHIERYAGLDPKQKWLGRAGSKELVDRLIPSGTPITEEKLAEVAVEAHRSLATIVNNIRTPQGTYSRPDLIKFLARRPWNNELKVICWHIGQSFMKFSARPDCFYGQYYLGEKFRYMERNARGEFAERARETLASKKIENVELRTHLEAGQLTPTHINAMARRKSVKLFLHHFWEVAYFRQYHQAPPMPWIIAHGGHEQYIDCPYFDLVPGFREAKAARAAGERSALAGARA